MGVELAVLGPAIALGVALYVDRVRSFLHIFQLEEYQGVRYLRWLWDRRSVHISLGWLIMGSSLGAATVWFALANGPWIPSTLAAGLWAGLSGWRLVGKTKRRPRKPLAYTARATRLLTMTLMVGTTLVFAPLAALAIDEAVSATSLALLAVVGLFVVSNGAGYVVVAANLGLFPVEEVLRRYYLRSATRKIKDMGPKIVSVTGSAGKTTTKELAAYLLSSRYRVEKTPGSYNTPMGISKVVNGMKDSPVDYFVVEMGAYESGDIRRLCEIVGPPAVAVVTQINEQHLERFGSLYNIIGAKFEAVAALRGDGTAVLNFDNPHIRQEARKYPEQRIISYAITAPDAVDLRGRVVDCGIEGTVMEISWRNGPEMRCHSRLLGFHNASNMLGAVAVAVSQGIDMKVAIALLKRFTPVKHRLQVMKAHGRIIIDDAYNSNPDGAREAVELLATVKDSRRIMVTPGLVELGEREVVHNRQLGELAASCCDLVILVGRHRTVPIEQGLRSQGFPPGQIITTDDFDAAAATLASIAEPGDVVLLENDLPDQYDERLRI